MIDGTKNILSGSWFERTNEDVDRVNLDRAIALSLETAENAAQSAAEAAKRAASAAQQAVSVSGSGPAGDAETRESGGPVGDVAKQTATAAHSQGRDSSEEAADLEKAIAASLEHAASAASAAQLAAKCARATKVVAGGGRRHRYRPVARYVKDVSIADGTVLPPGVSFTKIWRLRNEGVTAWPVGCRFQHVGGDKLHAPDGGVSLPALSPCLRSTGDDSDDSSSAEVNGAGELDIAVSLRTPRAPGRYVGYWRCTDASGQRFGHRVWIDIVVSESVGDTDAGDAEVLSAVETDAQRMSPEGAAAEIERRGSLDEEPSSHTDELATSDSFVSVELPAHDAGVAADIDAAKKAESVLVCEDIDVDVPDARVDADADADAPVVATPGSTASGIGAAAPEPCQADDGPSSPGQCSDADEAPHRPVAEDGVPRDEGMLALEEMGFCDPVVNRRALDEHDNDVSLALSWLVAQARE